MSCNRYPTSSWAETVSLRLDDDGVLWLRLVQIDDMDEFARLGPIEWHPEVPRGLRGELAKLLDLWLDAKRDDPAADQRHAYLLAISG